MASWKERRDSSVVEFNCFDLQNDFLQISARTFLPARSISKQYYTVRLFEIPIFSLSDEILYPT